jgi:hypothetical protein
MALGVLIDEDLLKGVRLESERVHHGRSGRRDVIEEDDARG